MTKSQELFSFPIHLQKIKFQSMNLLSQMNFALKGDKISELFSFLSIFTMNITKGVSSELPELIMLITSSSN